MDFGASSFFGSFGYDPYLLSPAETEFVTAASSPITQPGAEAIEATLQLLTNDSVSAAVGTEVGIGEVTSVYASEVGGAAIAVAEEAAVGAVAAESATLATLGAFLAPALAAIAVIAGASYLIYEVASTPATVVKQDVQKAVTDPGGVYYKPIQRSYTSGRIVYPRGFLNHPLAQQAPKFYFEHSL